MRCQWYCVKSNIIGLIYQLVFLFIIRSSYIGQTIIWQSVRPSDPSWSFCNNQIFLGGVLFNKLSPEPMTETHGIQDRLFVIKVDSQSA